MRLWKPRSFLVTQVIISTSNNQMMPRSPKSYSPTNEQERTCVVSPDCAQECTLPSSLPSSSVANVEFCLPVFLHTRRSYALSREASRYIWKRPGGFVLPTCKAFVNLRDDSDHYTSVVSNSQRIAGVTYQENGKDTTTAPKWYGNTPVGYVPSLTSSSEISRELLLDPPHKFFDLGLSTLSSANTPFSLCHTTEFAVFPRTMGGKHASDRDRYYIYMLRQQGLFQAEIAAKTGFSRARISYILKQPVTPQKRSGRPPKFDTEKRKTITDYIESGAEARDLL